MTTGKSFKSPRSGAQAQRSGGGYSSAGGGRGGQGRPASGGASAAGAKGGRGDKGRACVDGDSCSTESPRKGGAAGRGRAAFHDGRKRPYREEGRGGQAFADAGGGGGWQMVKDESKRGGSYKGGESGGYAGKSDGGYRGKTDGGYRGKTDGGYQGKTEGGYRGKTEGGYQGKTEGGYRGKTEGGYQGKSDGGYRGKTEGGYQGKTEGGYRGKTEGGYQGKSDGGYRGKSEGGYRGKTEGGYQGKSDGGYRGKTEGGYQGKSDGGYRGKTEGGYQGKSEGGYQGKTEGGYQGRSEGRTAGFGDQNWVKPETRQEPIPAPVAEAVDEEPTSRAVYGLNAVVALLSDETRAVDAVNVQNGLRGHRPEEIVRLAKARGVRLRFVEREALERLAGSPAHQGVVAMAGCKLPMSWEAFEERLKATPGALILLLDGVEDPRNLGAALRSAEAFGVLAVILPKDRSAPLTPSAMKSAAGAGEFVEVVRVTNLARTMEALRALGVRIYGLAGEGEQPLSAGDFSGSTALVMGGEESGLRHLTREKCDGLLAIPLSGHTPSLNVSVAAGIALYEATRQRAATAAGS